SFSISIGCAAACAGHVHEGTAIYFAHLRCNAIFARPRKNAARENTSAASAIESAQPRLAIRTAHGQKRPSGSALQSGRSPLSDVDSRTADPARTMTAGYLSGRRVNRFGITMISKVAYGD